MGGFVNFTTRIAPESIVAGSVVDYSLATAYTTGQIVNYNGALWTATANSTGQAPAAGSAYWEITNASTAQIPKGGAILNGTSQRYTHVDNASLDFGTGDFSIEWYGSLADYSSGFTQRIIGKYQDLDNRYQLSFATTGIINLFVKKATAVIIEANTTGIPFATENEVGYLTVVVTRETSTTDGSMKVFKNGAFFETVVIPSAVTVDISNTGLFELYHNGLGVDFFISGNIYFVKLHNYALTQQDVTDRWNNGQPQDFVEPYATRDATNEINAWVEVAPTLGAETYIISLAVLNGEIYGGTLPNGKLYKWNGTDAWVEVAGTLGAETSIFSLAVLNGKIYGGTNPNGKLYEWNDTNAWVEVAPKLGAETRILSLTVFNNKIYGGTNTNGKLYEWNDTNAWVEVAPKLGAETEIYSLTTFNNKIYGGTLPNGKLYEWNGTNAWVEVAPTLGGETQILSLTVFNNKIYGGTGQNSKLYEWNGTNAWVEVAPTLGAETQILSLTVFNGKIYGGTNPNGKLYEWNGTNAWVEVAPQLGAEARIYALTVLNGKIYGGTYPNGKLFQTPPKGETFSIKPNDWGTNGAKCIIGGEISVANATANPICPDQVKDGRQGVSTSEVVLTNTQPKNKNIKGVYVIEKSGSANTYNIGTSTGVYDIASGEAITANLAQFVSLNQPSLVTRTLYVKAGAATLDFILEYEEI